MEAGQQITANLRLVRQLGQGGMGAVWAADHLALGTQVAVKFMWRQFAEHPQFVERFRREAAAAARLKNPHVAQVFDHGVTPTGEPFIVMELLEGEDLGKRVKREGPLPPLLVADILSQAAKALGKAHQLGIVHRDIKADNIFLSDIDGDVFVKVLDFGIAKVSDDSNVSMTATGGTIGTPLFMSPEQFMSAKHVDYRADLWSLGVVAYYALTKKVPFPGDTIGAIAVAVHAGEFGPPSTLRPEIPPALDDWFLRAFRRNPDERFVSVKEMVEAFRGALGARASQVLALPSTPLESDVSSDTSDVQLTVRLPGPVVGAPDNSPKTLGGKSVTIGDAERRRHAVPLLVGALIVVAAIAWAGITRPWSRASADAGTGSAQSTGAVTSAGSVESAKGSEPTAGPLGPEAGVGAPAEASGDASAQVVPTAPSTSEPTAAPSGSNAGVVPTTTVGKTPVKGRVSGQSGKGTKKDEDPGF